MDQPDGVSAPAWHLRQHWELYFAASLAIGAGVGLLAGDGPLGRRLAAVGLLAAIAVWYWLFGRPHLLDAAENNARGVVYLAVAGVLFAGAVVLAPHTVWGSAALISQAFWFLSLRYALTVVIGLSFVPATLFVATRGGRWDVILSDFLPPALIFGSLSVLIGVTIHRVATQNERQAELIARLEASNAEVARLSHEAGTAAERERLAREIHDTLAQGFTSIVTLTQAIESELDSDVTAARRHLEMARRTARENLAEARAMVAALTPSALGDGSLADAVTRLADNLDAARCTVDPLPKLDTAAEVVLLRAAQEALHNARKHAAADEVVVDLSIVDELVVLTVTDDGTGFDPGQPAAGFGLSGMRVRAEQVGGRLTVTSAPGKGTTVRLEVPA
ncbi:sensor histidine kinase [Amycolatopsis suaedae]|uniref:sensor histidine kinase n=1 Tax=Amycolatopsis suaedae TaxID=2510978 RepID=UPI001F0F9155|nr:sensor histidine kinase [Amycolatopsis suaedae]